MYSDEKITKELNEQFTITCKKCGHTGVKFWNDVRYYQYTGKVGDAGIQCEKCGLDNSVILDE